MEFHREQARSTKAVDTVEERNSSLQARMEEMILKTGEPRDTEHLKAVRAVEETAPSHHAAV
eukprot:547706-Prorocentrum_lima.AAC.1